jgi:hypothetical protein
MNNHKMACVLLLILVGAMVYGTQEMNNRAKKAREAAESAKFSADDAERQRATAEMNLTRLERETSDLRKGFITWFPHFGAATTPQEGEQRIADAIRDGRVFLLSNRFNMKEFADENRGVLIGVLEGELEFEDDYVKTLNWLGKLEESVPNCRITSCNIIRGDRANNVRLKLKLEMPIMDPTVAETTKQNIAKS